MKERYRTAISNLSRAEHLLLAVSAVSACVVVATNPFATALPIAGTATVVGMMFGIDKLQPFVSNTSAPTTDSEPTSTSERSNATPCTADD
ncbi:hypothetical protein ACFQJ7_15610 [Halovenus rubra]|uniref:Uncharacterized protein n=2 Tax=Halovenus rubra TaxID=869890 RepID=A0ACC7E2E3_9EURY|nr:hypothetical protein [Halovenus rubra]